MDNIIREDFERINGFHLHFCSHIVEMFVYGDAKYLMRFCGKGAGANFTNISIIDPICIDFVGCVISRFIKPIYMLAVSRNVCSQEYLLFQLREFIFWIYVRE